MGGFATYHGGGPRAQAPAYYTGAGTVAALSETVWLGPEQLEQNPPSRDVAEHVAITLGGTGVMIRAIEIPVVSGGGVNLSAYVPLSPYWDGGIVYARAYYTADSGADAMVTPDIQLRGQLTADGQNLDGFPGLVGAAATSLMPAAPWDLKITGDIAITAGGVAPGATRLLWFYPWFWTDTRTVNIYLLGVRLYYGLS